MRSKNGRKRKTLKTATKRAILGTRGRASKSELSRGTGFEGNRRHPAYGIAGDLFWRYGKCVWVTI